MAIESVQLEGMRHPGQIEIKIHWRSGTVTILCFANNTSGTKPCRFSFLAARLRRATQGATAGNMLHRRHLRPRLTCS